MNLPASWWWPLVLACLSVLDGGFAGYRDAAGRDGRVFKDQFYRRAVRRGVVRLVLMRRRGAARRREDAFDDDLQLAGRERTDALAEHRDVQRAVAALPESLRDVFILKQVEGYRHDEIATLLGITEGASRVRLTRAVDALRRALVER